LRLDRASESSLDEDEKRQMTTPKPSFQSIAQRLILDASKGHEEAAAIAVAAEHVFQALHVHLARLIGAIGFRALLARSLTLASPGSPALARIQVTPEGAVAGLAEAIASTSPAEALVAPARLLAAFLDLLAAFVGDDLALHLVDEATRSSPEPDDPRVERASDEGSAEHR
jgi:hypothetical protein